MPRSSLLALCLALAGCAAESTAPPSQVQAAPQRPMPQSAVPFDAKIAALPVRPAGTALATASQEHALVRQQPILEPTVSTPAAHPGMAPTAAPGDALSVRVLAVQAAYRRWCDGEALPGDGPLLAAAGGVRLPGALACQPPMLGQPHPLIPESGRFQADGNRVL